MNKDKETEKTYICLTTKTHKP